MARTNGYLSLFLSPLFLADHRVPTDVRLPLPLCQEVGERHQELRPGAAAHRERQSRTGKEDKEEAEKKQKAES